MTDTQAGHRNYNRVITTANKVALAQGYAAAAPFYDLAQKTHDSLMATQATNIATTPMTTQAHYDAIMDLIAAQAAHDAIMVQGN